MHDRSESQPGNVCLQKPFLFLSSRNKLHNDISAVSHIDLSDIEIAPHLAFPEPCVEIGLQRILNHIRVNFPVTDAYITSVIRKLRRQHLCNFKL